MKKTLIALGALICSLVVGQPYPTYQAGKYVYTVPSDFDPPYVGQSGIQRLQAEASKLNYPFYVVFIKDLRVQGVTSDEAAANYIDVLSGMFATQGADQSRSQFFILSYNPQKYRFLAGSDFESRLGFAGHAHDPFLQAFLARVKNQRKDPLNGIIDLMHKVDPWLFERTDPATVAKRALQRAVARQQAELVNAKNVATAQIAKFNEYLRYGYHDPNKTEQYETLINNSRNMLVSNDITKLLAVQENLRPYLAELKAIVEEAEAKRASEARSTAIKVLLITIFWAGLFLALFFYYRGVRYTIAQARDYLAELKEMLATAYERFYPIMAERPLIESLASLQGKSADRVKAIQVAFDSLAIELNALGSQIAKAEKANSEFHWLLRPWRAFEVHRLLLDEFTYEADANKIGLFTPAQESLLTTIEDLLAKADQRYEAATEALEELRQSLLNRQINPMEEFPQSMLDKLIEDLNNHEISAKYLKSHPLYGDEASDKAFYLKIVQLAETDPVSAREMLDEALKKHNELNTLSQNLIDVKRLLEDLNSGKFTPLFKTSEYPESSFQSVVEFQDLKNSAKTGTGLFYQSLKNIATEHEIASDGLEKMRKTRQHCDVLFQEILNDVATIKDYQDELDAHIATQNFYREVARKHPKLLTKAGTAVDRQGVESEIHSFYGTVDVDPFLVLNKLQSIEQLLGDQIDALKVVLKEFRLQASSKHYVEEELQNLDRTYEQYQSTLRRYSSKGLSEPGHFPIDRVTDWVQMQVLLDRQKEVWQQEVNTAKREHEAEVARQERERILERQREEELEEARRRESYSSSSGSSWGSDDSSSSGSSWSGGSSSSSGGSW